MLGSLELSFMQFFQSPDILNFIVLLISEESLFHAMVWFSIKFYTHTTQIELKYKYNFLDNQVKGPHKFTIFYFSLYTDVPENKPSEQNLSPTNLSWTWNESGIILWWIENILSYCQQKSIWNRISRQHWMWVRKVLCSDIFVKNWEFKFHSLIVIISFKDRLYLRCFHATVW